MNDLLLAPRCRDKSEAAGELCEPAALESSRCADEAGNLRELIELDASSRLISETPAAGAIASPPASQQITLSGPAAAALNSRLIVFTLLFVAGPFGLPALWFSPRFSRISKIVWTVLFFLLTVALPLAGAWYLFELVLRPIVDAMSAVNA
jgi:hypothetical protein